MRAFTLVALSGAILFAQHVEYPRNHIGTPTTRVLRDSRGQFVVGQRSVAFGPGPSGSSLVFVVSRYSSEWDALPGQLFVTDGSDLKALNLDQFDPAVGLDRKDRFYMGGMDSSGHPWLRRERDWRMQPTSAEGTVSGIAFDDADQPILLITGKGRPAVWLINSDNGSILRTFEFGQAGQSVSAMVKATDGAIYLSAGSTVTRISDLSRIDFEVQLGTQTELAALAVRSNGLYAAGSTTDTPGSFPATPGAFMERPPLRSTRGNRVAVVARMDPKTGVVLAASYLGASAFESGRGIAVDDIGVYLLGATASRDFPVTGAYRTHCGPDRSALGPAKGNNASFIVKLDPDLRNVIRSATFPFETIPELTAPEQGIFTLRGAGIFRFAPDREETAQVRCLVSAASYEPVGVAVPGLLVSLFGQGLGPEEPLVFDGQVHLPRQVSGTEVLFDGVPAPLLAVLSTQINFLIPFDLPQFSPGWIEVRRDGRTLLRKRLGWTEAIEPILLLRISGKGELVAVGSAVEADVLNEDGSRNSADNPATPGSLVTVFATGIGRLRDPSPEEDAGGAVPATPRDFQYVIDTAGGFLEPETVSTVTGRNKGVIQVRFRGPSNTHGPPGFRVTIKALNAQIPTRPLPYLFFAR